MVSISVVQMNNGDFTHEYHDSIQRTTQLKSSTLGKLDCLEAIGRCPQILLSDTSFAFRRT